MSRWTLTFSIRRLRPARERRSRADSIGFTLPVPCAAFTDFKKAIIKQADIVQSLTKYKLEKVKATDDTFTATIDSLFDDLRLTQTKSSLVTFSKAMHFIQPDLFRPVDRWYTLRFFYESTPVNEKTYFLQVFEQFRQFAHEHHETLMAQVDKASCWNRNIPKVIDNIIIAYVSEKME